MYAYGIIKCIDQVYKDEEGKVSLIKNKLCNPNNTLKICDMSTKNIHCNNSNSYILVELLQNPISLETFIKNINNDNQRDVDNFFSILLQISLSLKIAQILLGFNHNDLHLGNVLLLPNPNKKDMVFTYSLNDENVFNVVIYDYIAIIIDFGNSRTNKTEKMVKKHWSVYNNNFFNELYVFNENSDILSLLLAIKTLWYYRFYNVNNLEYTNIIPLIGKNPIFNKNTLIDTFLNGIRFPSNLEIVNINNNNVITYYTFVMKKRKGGSHKNIEEKNIDNIINDLLIYQDNIVKKRNFDIIYNWGISSKIGPIIDENMEIETSENMEID